ncbi:phage major tail tube protein [Salmonella enterica]|uniref:Phage major tail tube protein n=1 Tax=Salmonella enterica I TaxID=59201 RepID=A0A5U3EUL3_SALET|nr:phage major tail tube protein [Salmonella enterica subsp. diarizonae]EBP3998756.1 phage major tail tube protein [Salmonella enterica subsp. enterica]ELB6470204.1 phage major tail tube protein [Salmonella enterica]
MGMPAKLKYFNIYNAGNNWRGIAESITLPKLTRKLENYRGAGMNGAAPVDLGLDDEALSFEWTLGGIDPLPLEQLGDPVMDSSMLRFVGSFERDDTGDVVAVEVVFRGRHKEVDFGEFKQGENTQLKVSSQCTYFKLSIDGELIVEIDTPNFVENVAGKDRLAKHRNILGL